MNPITDTDHDIDPSYPISEAARFLRTQMESDSNAGCTKADIVRRELGLGKGDVFYWESDAITEAEINSEWRQPQDSATFGLQEVCSRSNFDRSLSVRSPDFDPRFPREETGCAIDEFSTYERLYRDYRRGTLLPVEVQTRYVAERPDGETITIA